MEKDMATVVVGFLLEDLKQLLGYGSYMVVAEKDQIELLFNELEILRAFLEKLEGEKNEQNKLNIFVTQIKDAACEVLDDLDSLVLSAIRDETKAFEIGSTFCGSSKIRYFIQVTTSITKEVKKIYSKKLYGIGVPPVESSAEENWLRTNRPSVEEGEIVVGFDNEIMAIKERLVGAQKQLDIISIVGMGGQGKTTLAREVYNDLYIEHHFHIRGWTRVSQIYKKMDLLKDMLSSFDHRSYEDWTEKMMREALYKRLKGRRYLIVLDDIWDIEVWNDLNILFPDDNSESRILLTTRFGDVSLHIKPNSPPHSLCFLTEEKSWDLLQHKTFLRENCPPQLLEIGKQIAAKCKGLPLAIVVVAGVLAKKEKKLEVWNQVANNLRSLSDEFMDILMLSYNHLPPHLKPCFLYFGAFQKEYEIPVRKLTWLWIGHGFVQQTGTKSLEDAAKEYLRNLVERNLIIVAKRSLDGGIKACCIHDMLHELCLRKAIAKNWLRSIDNSELAEYPVDLFLRDDICVHSQRFHYFSAKPCSPHIHCSFMCSTQRYLDFELTEAFIYKLVTVLDLFSIHLSDFPKGILQLVHLRYLALHFRHYRIYIPSLCNLWNLETFILDGSEFTFPASIWKMVKLRHLRTSPHMLIYDNGSSNENESMLGNLQTMGMLHLSHSSNYVLARTPNLRKLSVEVDNLSIFSRLTYLGNLNQLETFKIRMLVRTRMMRVSRRESRDSDWLLPPITIPYPSNLKKLTLSRFSEDSSNWNDTSDIEKLPNLEVLVLECYDFPGDRWETNEGGFPRLKVLKLLFVVLQQWKTSNSHFPRLERLVVDKCHQFGEIPSELGDIPTLETIEVFWSSQRAKNSARQIMKEQEFAGNHVLKVVIYPHVEEEESERGRGF